MNTTFEIVRLLLEWISQATGFSYNEVNIIAYYIVLPFAYIVLADKILGRHILKAIYIPGVAVSLVCIKDFPAFSDWLFQKSVDFLLSFQTIGWSYIVASVMICVVFPVMVFAVLFHFAFPNAFRALFRLVSPGGHQQKPSPSRSPEGNGNDANNRRESTSAND